MVDLCLLVWLCWDGEMFKRCIILFSLKFDGNLDREIELVLLELKVVCFLFVLVLLLRSILVKDNVLEFLIKWFFLFSNRFIVVRRVCEMGIGCICRSLLGLGIVIDVFLWVFFDRGIVGVFVFSLLVFCVGYFFVILWFLFFVYVVDFLIFLILEDKVSFLISSLFWVILLLLLIWNSLFFCIVFFFFILIVVFYFWRLVGVCLMENLFFFVLNIWCWVFFFCFSFKRGK